MCTFVQSQIANRTLRYYSFCGSSKTQQHTQHHTASNTTARTSQQHAHHSSTHITAARTSQQHAHHSSTHSAAARTAQQHAHQTQQHAHQTQHTHQTQKQQHALQHVARDDGLLSAARENQAANPTGSFLMPASTPPSKRALFISNRSLRSYHRPSG